MLGCLRLLCRTGAGARLEMMMLWFHLEVSPVIHKVDGWRERAQYLWFCFVKTSTASVKMVLPLLKFVGCCSMSWHAWCRGRIESGDPSRWRDEMFFEVESCPMALMILQRIQKKVVQILVELGEAHIKGYRRGMICIFSQNTVRMIKTENSLR